MFIDRKTDKYIEIYFYTGKIVNNKNEQTTDIWNNMSKSQKS